VITAPAVRRPETMPCQAACGYGLRIVGAGAWGPWADRARQLAAEPDVCLTSARVIRSVRAGL
jgi:hypothetical protein